MPKWRPSADVGPHFARLAARSKPADRSGADAWISHVASTVYILAPDLLRGTAVARMPWAGAPLAMLDLFFRKYAWTASLALIFAAAWLCARTVNTVVGAAIRPRPAIDLTTLPRSAPTPAAPARLET